MISFILKRFKETKNITLGKMKIFKDNILIFECVTLEPQGEDCFESGKNRRIPKGDYDFNFRESWKFGWTPHLWNENVAKTRYILIHKGNFRQDTQGCILVGKSINGECITNSKETFEKLCKILTENKIKKLRIENV